MEKIIDLNDALDRLAVELPIDTLIDEDWSIVAISEAGIYLAKLIAQITKSKFDILFSEPVYAPNNDECKIAMVSETQEIVIHQELVEAFDISLDFVYGQALREYEEKIVPYMYKYRKGESIRSLKDTRVMFVSEGIDTGLTAMSAIKTAIKAGAKTVSIATPLISLDIFNTLNEITDDIYTAHKIREFINIEYYYEDSSKLKYDYLKNIMQETQITKGD